jgi:hypothetical protein
LPCRSAAYRAVDRGEPVVVEVTGVDPRAVAEESGPVRGPRVAGWAA